VLATPVLGEMKGMGNMKMSGMAGMSGMSMAPSPLVATLRAGDALHGHALFDGQRCAQCHGVGGSGGGGAPALIGIAKTLKPEQIYDYIKNPRATMPNFHLSDNEIADLVAYVDSLTPGHTVAADIDAEHPGPMMGMSMSGMSGMAMAQAPPVYAPDQAPKDNGPHGLFPGLESGDPSIGAKLFSTNCASCHGAGGSGGFGPKLVGLADQVTPSFFAWRIKDPTAPMPKLPLTDAQIADLAAYLETLGASSGTLGSSTQHSEAHR